MCGSSAVPKTHNQFISTRADSPAGAQPILTCGLAQEDDEAIWEGLCRLLDPRWSRESQVWKPEALPWLAVVILPAALQVPLSDVSALADFERCLAWAIIEETPHE
jgi:hypothetical protein